MNRIALIIVDLQNDFCPGGALVVPSGDEIVPVVNHLVDRFLAAGLPIFATRDWHPENHCSFIPQGGPWPDHCVQNTEGARFHPDLRLPDSALIVSKADSPGRDAYSGFEGTDLAQQLNRLGVEELIVCGLATDYCVKATVLDGIKNGFGVTVVEDGIRGVNVHPGDSEKALRQMKDAGAELVKDAGSLTI